MTNLHTEKGYLSAVSLLQEMTKVRGLLVAGLGSGCLDALHCHAWGLRWTGSEGLPLGKPWLGGLLASSLVPHPHLGDHSVRTLPRVSQSCPLCPRSLPGLSHTVFRVSPGMAPLGAKDSPVAHLEGPVVLCSFLDTKASLYPLGDPLLADHLWDHHIPTP